MSQQLEAGTKTNVGWIFWPSIVALVLALVLLHAPEKKQADSSPEPGSSSAKAVTCDRFQIVQTRTGDMLSVSLDTDLPDFTDIMVSVSRAYFEKGDPNAYPLDYIR